MIVILYCPLFLCHGFAGMLVGEALMISCRIGWDGFDSQRQAWRGNGWAEAWGFLPEMDQRIDILRKQNWRTKTLTRTGMALME
jgi:hypothetical protein